MDDLIELAFSASFHEGVKLCDERWYVDKALEVSVSRLGLASAAVSDPASTNQINAHL